MKHLFSLLTILLLSACVSNQNPWDRNVHTTTAQSAPSSLSAETIAHSQPPQPVGTEQEAMSSRYEIPNEGGLPPTMQTAAGYPPVDRAPVMAPVKVGLLLPLSGQHADLGEALLQAAQLALFDIGFNSMELITRDTKGTSSGAQEAAASAINAGAQIILGPLFADSVRAVKPVAGRYNINVVAFSTDWTLAGGNTYIMGFLPFAQVQRVAEYAYRNGYRHIGILAPSDNYGNAVIAAYNSMAYRRNLPPASIARYTANSSDISNIVRTFSNYDAREAAKTEDMAQSPITPPFDAILLATGGEQARSVAGMLSYYDLGPNAVKRLGTGLWDDNALATDPALKNGWFAAPSPSARAEFERHYSDTYGLVPPRLASLAYDATALAAVLARNSQSAYGRPSFSHTDLTNPNGFAGIDGIFRFRPDGLVERGLAVLEFKNGMIKEIDPAPRTFQSVAGR